MNEYITNLINGINNFFYSFKSSIDKSECKCHPNSYENLNEFESKIYPGGLEIKYWYKNGKLHRDEDLPAEIAYRVDGSKLYEKWYKNGMIHRINDKPALIEYDEDNNIICKIWYQNNNIFRENNLPNFILYYSDKHKLLYNMYNTENRIDDDSPLFILNKGKLMCEEWFINGRITNFIGPSQIFYDGDGNVIKKIYNINSKKITKEKFNAFYFKLRHKILSFKNKKRKEIYSKLTCKNIFNNDINRLIAYYSY